MNLLKFNILAIFILTLSIVFAGNPNGARSFGLAGNSTQLKDIWATENNPAALSFLKSWGAGFSYESSFLLPELSTRTAIFTHPVQNGSFGLSFQQFGYSAYNENKIGLSYGQTLSKRFSLGIQLNYLNTRISEGYGNNSALSGNIGLYSILSDKLSLAVLIVNPNRAQLATFEDERYPTKLNLGLIYEFSKKVQLLSEISKDIDYEASVKVGIEYQAIDKLYLRAGYATEPALSTFGFGLNLDKFRMDFASGFDSNLGFSPQLSISFVPTKNEK